LDTYYILSVMMSVDYSSNTICINKELYDLTDLKKFLLDQFPSLVGRSFIKAIRFTSVKQEVVIRREGDLIVWERSIYGHGKIYFTYDWQEVIKIAERTVLPLYEFTLMARPVKQVACDSVPDPEECATIVNYGTTSHRKRNERSVRVA
jgi:hypothetical protein